MHMSTTTTFADRQNTVVSPLMLSHQLLSLAEEAHRAGLPASATRLLRLAHTVCNDRPARR